MNKIVKLGLVVAAIILLGAVVKFGLGLWDRYQHQSEFGFFEPAEPELKFLTNGGKVELLSDISFHEPDQQTWTAPKGLKSDCASIPSWAWSIIGVGPCTGAHRLASFVHDFYVLEENQHLHPPKKVHEMYHRALLASGEETWRANAMYLAVLFGGPNWDHPENVNVPEMIVTASQSGDTETYNCFTEGEVEICQVTAMQMSSQSIEEVREEAKKAFLSQIPNVSSGDQELIELLSKQVVTGSLSLNEAEETIERLRLQLVKNQINKQ